MKKIIILAIILLYSKLFAYTIFDNPTQNCTEFQKYVKVDFDYDTFETESNNYLSQIFFNFPTTHNNYGFGFSLNNQDDERIFGSKLHFSKRFNKLFLIGANVSLLTDFADEYYSQILRAITYKPFRNYAVTCYSEFEIDKDANYDFFYALNNKFYLNNYIQFEVDITSSRDFFSQLSTRLKNFQISGGFKTNMDFEKEKYFVNIAYLFDKSHFELSTLSNNLESSNTISYKQNYGKYYPPIVLKNVIAPINKKHVNLDGLVLQNEAKFYHSEDVIITINKGDNLYHISKNLPKNVDPYFINNVKAISEYNNLENPSKIFVGQKIKILWKLENIQKIKNIVPKSGGLGNSYLLNSQAIVNIVQQDFEQAIDKLKQASEISPNKILSKLSIN